VWPKPTSARAGLISRLGLDFEPHLKAAFATVPVPAPLGVDMVGFLRRHVGVEGHGQPLEVNVLVADDGLKRCAVIALDMLGTRGEHGVALRMAVAEAAQCDVDAVLVNCQHTHSAPPPPGLIKMGGLNHNLSLDEVGYWEQLVRSAATAAGIASRKMAPVRMGSGRGVLEALSVNRRERLGDGTTIIGWNREGECDRSVSVLRFEHMDGSAAGTVVNFACHPVLVGPDVSDATADYVGPLRSAVRAFTGADCLFLQGCAGNVVPLECLHEYAGPEVDFGHRLALAALTARSEAKTKRYRLERTEYRSAVPLARYRWIDSGPIEGCVDFAVKAVELPLDPHPSRDEIRRVREQLESRVEELKSEGAGPERWNPVDIHAHWARNTESQIEDRSAPASIPTIVQVLRVGHAAIVGLPGEPFNEIGSRIKSASPAEFTITCGYSNDAVGYIPTSEEFPFGGYEVEINHRHYGNPSPISVGADLILQESAAELLARLF
jgi:neutral ceramidase